MAYSTISKPSLHFNTKLYIGNTSARSISGIGFQPDWCWFKNRSQSNGHSIFDAVRGATKNIISNASDAESTSSNGLTAFASDGFSIGSDGDVNGLGDDIVAWNWKAGTGQGSSNTDGSINTTYTSVNTTAGFSISKFTGTGANATVGHGLGAVPKTIITKNLSSANNWAMYHVSTGNTKSLQLDTNGAPATSAAYWNNTTPTSSVFTVSTGNDVNKSGDSIIAYCFAEKKGYSKFGSYSGNANADGAFIYTGFSPAFIIIRSTSGNHWMMRDNKRPGFNANFNKLFPDRNVAENTDTSNQMDFLSNGFKLRASNTEQNGSSTSYIYMAFAAEPLVANVGESIPATAV